MRLSLKYFLLILTFIHLLGCSNVDYTKDFNFSFKYGVMTKNVLNTFDNKYTKDLVQNGVVTVDFVITKEDKRKIYDYMNDIDIFSYPNEVEGNKMDPASGYILEVQYDGKKKVINWIGGFKEDIDQHQEFKGLTNLIIEVIEKNEVYKSLPKSNGAYE
ncbi:hypothetical protein [Paenibacillus sp. R14(2021)]|uniref:hypothetical protein n=1 Tax=Paenibacillus sp. R14(2021) TaxID=2859228 RepID=UPI001C61174D|nr:hypothetical protein [Paenibacillus sp. R14(2021)]